MKLSGDNDQPQTIVEFDANDTELIVDPTATMHESPTSDMMIGKIFQDKYLIEKRLGNGGMGIVYRAKHLLMDRYVAIKLLATEMADNSKAQEYFKREARAAGRIQHPNAASVLDFGPVDGVFYLVMEYLEGQTLRERLKDVGCFSCYEALQIISEICQAVTAAHNCNVIHRDLKPDNIFLQQKDNQTQVKVLDFGIAKIIEDGSAAVKEVTGKIPADLEMIGTPYYMSPEQFQNEELSHHTDIYSIGVISFEMLSGSRPFLGNSPFSIAIKHIRDEPPNLNEINPQIPAAVTEVIRRAMSKNPNQRQSSAVIFAEELRQAWDNVATKKFIKVKNRIGDCASPDCNMPQWHEGHYCEHCHTMKIGTLLRQRYRVEQFIAQGGFGATYLVVDQDCLNKKRVLKDLNFAYWNTGYSDEDREMARRLFKREAEVMCNLNHSGIPNLYAFFMEGNHSYLVQDYIPGQTLKDVLRHRAQPFSENEAIEVLLELSDILEYLHTQRSPIIHRDIKLQNIMRHEDGNLVLIDFGAVFHAASKLPGDQTIIGSPGYMPPEQIMGEVFPQSDIYALAASIIYLLTGIAPLRLLNNSTQLLEWEHQVNVSAKFGALLKEMLHPLVSERVKNGAALKSRLKRLKSDSPHQETDQPTVTVELVAQSVVETIDISSIAVFCYEIETRLCSTANANFYKILDVEPSATDAELQQAYEKIINRFHPDKHRELIKQNQLIQIQLSTIITRASDAYTQLKNAATRKKYDDSLRHYDRSSCSYIRK